MSANTEEYLEALYTLTQGGKKASTSAISRRLNIAPASVTEMLKKLSEEELIDYTPYKGVTLSPKGYRQAEKMARKHRLLERFLHDVLGIGNDKVHREACGMEHALSDETARAMCQTLQAPDKCPDDDKIIPACDFQFASCDECRQIGARDVEDIERRPSKVVALSTLKERQAGKVAFVRGDNALLRRLLEMGLTPGTTVSVTKVAPFNGPVQIAVRGSKLALGDEVAANVFIEA